MTTTSITFIGGGNMSRALICGLLPTNNFDIHASDPGAEARSELNKLQGVKVYSDNAEAAAKAQCIVFAVKPQIMQTVCQPLTSIIKQQQALVISVAAGIECGHMSQWFENYHKIIRVMPNTPALMATGATGLYGAQDVSDVDKSLATQIFSSVGVAQWVEQESLIDVVTAVSGSGPAYFFYMLESMEATAVKMGLPKETAQILARNTALGAAKMAIAEAGELNTLRERVTSPGGTTAAALASFSDNQLAAIVDSALRAAEQRAQELAQEFGQ